MTSPYFPSVDPTTRTLREKYVPPRLQPAALSEFVQDTVGSMIVPGAGIDAPYSATLGTVTISARGVSAGFADVRLGNGDGTTTAQTVSAGSFTTVTLNTELSDAGARFDTTTSIYTCQATGLYDISARLRVVDAAVDGRNIGIGVHTSNVDGAWFQWFKVATSGTGGRWTAGYVRKAFFTAGDQLRLYVYSDGGTLPINTAGMTVTYLGG